MAPAEIVRWHLKRPGEGAVQGSGKQQAKRESYAFNVPQITQHEAQAIYSALSSVVAIIVMNEVEDRHFYEGSALLAVAKEQSFVGAGRLLQRHATIVSKRIAALETRLGVRLVERTTRRVRLTETGVRLVERLKSAYDMMLEAEEEASAGAAELRGKLRLAFPAAMGRIWLAPLLPAFMERFSELEIEVEYSERYVDLVAEGFDAAIRIGVLRDSRLIAKKLCDHRRVLCASPDYVRRFGKPSHPQELRRHKLLGYSGFASSPEWRLSDGKRHETIFSRGLLRSNDVPALLESAKAGAGIMGAGEWIMARDFIAGSLVPILPGWVFDSEGGIFLVRPSVQFTPARTKALVAWITEAFKNGPPWRHDEAEQD